MDMSLSYYSAPRLAKRRPRLATAAAVASLALLAVLAAPALRPAADERPTASEIPSCLDVFRGVSEMQMINLARPSESRGLTCSLRGSAGR
jgi:hypothetical protein